MTATELRGGEGGASLSESIFEIDTVRGTSEGTVSDRTGEAVQGKRSEAVQTAGPVGGDTVRASFPESKASDKRSRDILGAKLKAVWAKVESNRERIQSITATNPANRGKKNHADANFKRSKQDLHDEAHAYCS